MSNMHGTWRCVSELDTVHIHVMEVSNHDVELPIGNPHLLSCTVQAGLGVSNLEPPEFGGLEFMDAQCA